MAVSLSAPQSEAEPPSPIEQELQTLSYAVAHDLSASIRQMTAFSQMLAVDLGDEMTPRRRQFVDHLRATGGHCAARLDQLLVYSQVVQRKLVRTLHDPTAAVRLAGLRLAGGGDAAAAPISVEPLGLVYADADLILQAAATLLDNAVKFRRPDVAARVIVAPAHDDVFWRMRVRDHGVGVEPGLREVAFSMFRRLNSANAYPGVGAGLAICRRIARRHGGEVKFLDCSEGACIELTIPQMGGPPQEGVRATS